MTVIYVDAPGTLTWSQAVQHAKSLGARLPTKDEVQQSVQQNGSRPLFQTDIWVPVIDSHSSWVSVGNCEPHIRLAKTHQKCIGSKPVWSEDPTFQAFRTKLGLVYTKVVLIPTNGTLGYSAAKNYAHSMGARLATKAEIRALIALNNNQPLLGQDLWLPANDKHGVWISAGNCEPHVRLAKNHTKLFGAPVWSEDPSHHAFRNHIAVVFENQVAANQLRFVAAPGTLGWHASNQFAAAHGSRLPTHAEVARAIQANWNQPLFQQDVWVPVSDAADTWVSVGNCEPHVRLAKSHTQLFGVPAWTNDPSHHAFRSFIGLVPSSNITFIQTAGTLTYSQAQAYAASMRARLPTAAEAKAAIYARNWQPLFNQDIWIPVADAPHTWVSVGNCEPHVRLGKTHTELFGVPGWTEDPSHHAFRTQVGVVFQH